MSDSQDYPDSPLFPERRPDFQRLLTALNHREADHVPFIEFIIEPDVKAAFLGRTIRNHADDIENGNNATTGI